MNEARYRTEEDRYWAAYGVGERDEQVVAVPSMETNVRVQMVGEGEPLLFVHGGPNAGTTFAPLAAQLLDRRCIVIDRPGCGLSPGVDYSRASFPDLAAAILKQTLDGLGIDRCDVVASSLGGAWALWFATAHPERVAAMVQLSSPAFVADANFDAYLFLRLVGLPGIGALMTMLPPSRKSSEMTFRSMGHAAVLEAGGLPDEFFSWSASLMKDTDTMRHDRRAIQKGMTFGALRGEVIIDDDYLRAIPHHTYWYWGMCDPFADVSAAEKYAELMPDAVLEKVPDSGHLPWLDDPDRAARAIRSAHEGGERAG